MVSIFLKEDNSEFQRLASKKKANNMKVDTSH